ncbi:MAG: hypothetical protein FWF14_04570, partial [Streptococcaceae bacterium]|nr:hypothetical protein [Streptococcaceae bacterium]
LAKVKVIAIVLSSIIVVFSDENCPVESVVLVSCFASSAAHFYIEFPFSSGFRLLVLVIRE